jgi:hypothetical protein
MVGSRAVAPAGGTRRAELDEHVAPGEEYGSAIVAELEQHGVLHFGPADWLLIVRMQGDGTPEHLAVETIARIHDRDPKRRRLAYYVPAIDEARQELADMQAPGIREQAEPCDSFELFAVPGRLCLHCSWPETDHGTGTEEAMHKAGPDTLTPTAWSDRAGAFEHAATESERQANSVSSQVAAAHELNATLCHLGATLARGVEMLEELVRQKSAENDLRAQGLHR